MHSKCCTWRGRLVSVMVRRCNTAQIWRLQISSRCRGSSEGTKVKTTCEEPVISCCRFDAVKEACYSCNILRSKISRSLSIQIFIISPRVFTKWSIDSTVRKPLVA
jgi:hypothetical protein